jgi:signal transduction histidine kinase
LALNVELLEEETGENLEARALLRAVKNEVERLTALSERYLSVARRKPPSFESEDVGELCREAMEFLRADFQRHGVEILLNLSPVLPAVRVDEGQIKQVLYNLLRNAREAMPGGGRITLGASPTPDGGVTITVDDEGEGIDEGVRTRLFEPFFTTKGHGTGLGLVITREVVEAHGGSVRCDRLEPRGTRFSVFLPAAGDAPETSVDGARNRVK